MIKLKPHITNIAPDDLTKIDGVRGPFYVSLVGHPREVDIGDFYGDDTYQFFIYANWVKLKEGGQDIEVQAISWRPIAEGGGPLEIPSQDIEYIKANISKLFRERDFSNPKYPIRAENVPSSIEFTWGLRS